MSEKTVQIETSLLVKGDCQHCIERLQERLRTHSGIERVHFSGEPTRLCLHFDPNLVTLASVERMAKQTGSELSERYQHTRIAINTGSSADFAASLEEHLEGRDGVLHASVNHAAGVVSLAYDSEKVCLGKLRQAIEERGFRLAEEALAHEHVCGGHHHDHGHGVGCAHGVAPSFLPASIKRHWTWILVAAAGAFFGAGALGEMVLDWPSGVCLGLYIMAYIAGGYDISTHAFPGLLKGRFDTDILMLAAAAGAGVLGKWGEGAFLLFLFALGHAGEHYALDRARNAIDALGEFMPKTAQLMTEEGLLETPVGSLQVGQVVVVRPGDRIPVDGHIVDGHSLVDQSPITGESVPVEKSVGAEVFAGTVNQQNALEVEVGKLAKDNTLARVMEMVAEAQGQKSPTQQLTQQFTSKFVPTVLLLTLGVIFVPPMLELLSWRESFYRAMLLLVASSPCALALGTPATVLAGIGQAARNGVLIKGGVHLENLGSLKAIALDKTGTLTEGLFQVQDVVVESGIEELELLRVAASVESQSNHPIALALVKEAAAREIELGATGTLENEAGRGVTSQFEGEKVWLGSLKLFELEGSPTPSASVSETVERLQGEGKTTVVVGRGEGVLGVVAVADTARVDAAATLARLRKLGIRELVMLTGDNQSAAEKIASQVGVTDVRAGLLPEDKLKAVKEIQAKVGTLGMIGDGVNDAPALAAADVGIAMGGAGTAVALETADVALMGDDLSKLPFAVGLSRLSRNVIRQNLAIAIGVILLLVLTSVTGVLELGWTVAAHEGSTIVVVFNALRLLRYTP